MQLKLYLKTEMRSYPTYYFVSCFFMINIFCRSIHKKLIEVPICINAHNNKNGSWNLKRDRHRAGKWQSYISIVYQYQYISIGLLSGCKTASERREGGLDFRSEVWLFKSEVQGAWAFTMVMPFSPLQNDAGPGRRPRVKRCKTQQYLILSMANYIHCSASERLENSRQLTLAKWEVCPFYSAPPFPTFLCRLWKERMALGKVSDKTVPLETGKVHS